MTYTITASNATGVSLATVMITVNLSAPNLVDAPAQTYMMGQAITTLAFTNEGGAVQVNGCTTSPNLPMGLMLTNTPDNRSCQISGTPSTEMAQATTYTITATNTAGFGEASISISILRSAPPTPPVPPKVVDLPEFNRALDIDNLVFTTFVSDFSNPPWFSQTAVTQDGVDALQSGAIDHAGSRFSPRNKTCIRTTIDTAVLGAGQLSYYIRVSSEGSFDGLETNIDNMSAGSDSGFQDWSLRTHDFATGSSTIRWCYEKNADTSEASDAAWLDNFMYIPTTQ